VHVDVIRFVASIHAAEHVGLYDPSISALKPAQQGRFRFHRDADAMDVEQIGLECVCRCECAPKVLAADKHLDARPLQRRLTYTTLLPGEHGHLVTKSLILDGERFHGTFSAAASQSSADR